MCVKQHEATRLILTVVPLLALAAGCTTAPSPKPAAPPPTPLLLSDPAPRPMPSLVLVPATRLNGVEFTMTFEPVKMSSDTCQLIENVSTMSATFSVPPEGEVASIRFGDDVFVGSVKGGLLDVYFRGEFDWNDGCRWETVQRIRGDLSSGSVHYTYSESPLSKPLDCADPCSGEADVRVKRLRS